MSASLLLALLDLLGVLFAVGIFLCGFVTNETRVMLCGIFMAIIQHSYL